MVDANELARKTLAEARERRLIETADRNDNPPPPISTYAGFDCKTGEALLRPAGGGIVRGQPLYNTAVRPGDIMDLHVSQGLPKADSLSAWEPEPVTVVEEREVFGKIKILFSLPDESLWIGGDRRTPKRIGTTKDRVFYTLQNQGDGDKYKIAYADYSGTDAILGWIGGRSQTLTGVVDWYDDLLGAPYRGAVFFVSDGVGIGDSGWDNFAYISTNVGNYSVTRENYAIFPNVTFTSLMSKSSSVAAIISDEGSIIVEKMSGTIVRSAVSDVKISGSITAYSEYYYERVNSNPIPSEDGIMVSRRNNVFPLIYGVDSSVLWGQEIEEQTIVDRVTEHRLSERNLFLNNTQGTWPPPPLTRATLKGGTVYNVQNRNEWEPTAAPIDVYAFPDWDKTTISVKFSPIPQDAIVIDWSYHP